MAISERRPCPPPSRSRRATRHFSWDAASAPRTTTARRPAPASPGYSSRPKRCCSATPGRQITSHFFGPNPREPNVDPTVTAQGTIRAAWRHSRDSSTVSGSGRRAPSSQSATSQAGFRAVAAGRGEGSCGGSGRRRHADAHDLHSTRQHLWAGSRRQPGARWQQMSARKLSCLTRPTTSSSAASADRDDRNCSSPRGGAPEGTALRIFLVCARGGLDWRRRVNPELLEADQQPWRVERLFQDSKQRIGSDRAGITTLLIASGENDRQRRQAGPAMTPELIASHAGQADIDDRSGNRRSGRWMPGRPRRWKRVAPRSRLHPMKLATTGR